MKLIYLDNAATTPIASEAFEAMRPFLTQHFGNPSSIHSFGREARAAIEKARGEVAKALAVSPGEILFTSSATEANNLAIKGVAMRCFGEPCHMILSAVEHSSVRNVYGYLKERFPHVSLTVLEVDGEGRVNPQALEAALQPETVLVSVMHANNETGAVQPVAQLSEVVRRHGKALLHCDAVQTFAKLPVRPKEIGADLLTVSSHKIYGPKGAGALYIRDNLKLEALHHGGSQEKRRRAGTEDTAAIVGFGMAANLGQELLSWTASHLRQLERRFLQTLDAEGCGYMINGCRENCLGGLLNLSFLGTSSQDLVVALDLEGVAVSSGSACHSGVVEPSHVLQAMGMGEDRLSCSIRFSFGRTILLEDAEEAAARTARVVKRAQAMAAKS